MTKAHDLTGMTDEVVEGLAEMLESMAAEVRRRRPVRGTLRTRAHVIELPLIQPRIERASGGLARFEVTIDWDIDPERVNAAFVEQRLQVDS